MHYRVHITGTHTGEKRGMYHHVYIAGTHLFEQRGIHHRVYITGTHPGEQGKLFKSYGLIQVSSEAYITMFTIQGLK